MAETIRAKLETRFEVISLEVTDESERHRGHSGWREGGETHFRVAMTARDFAGQSRLARARAVHRALGDELESRVHALALELKAPD